MHFTLVLTLPPGFPPNCECPVPPTGRSSHPVPTPQPCYSILPSPGPCFQEAPKTGAKFPASSSLGLACFLSNVCSFVGWKENLTLRLQTLLREKRVLCKEFNAQGSQPPGEGGKARGDVRQVRSAGTQIPCSCSLKKP